HSNGVVHVRADTSGSEDEWGAASGWRSFGDSAVGTQGGSADGPRLAAHSTYDSARTIRHDHFSATSICSPCRILRDPRGRAGGNRLVRNSDLSREQSYGGDRCTHGGGCTARTSGLDGAPG